MNATNVVNPILKPGLYIGADLHAHDDMKSLLLRFRGVGCLSDEELMRVHEFLRDLDERMAALGIEFSLAINELRRRYDEAEAMRRARCDRSHVRS